MKMRPLLTTLLLSSLAAGACAATGCGVIKGREDRIVTASQAGSSQQAGTVGSSDPEDEEIRQIRQFLDLYTDHGAMTRQGLANFFEKYKAQIAPFLAGLHMSSQDLIDLVFQFDANHDGQITPRELSDGLLKRIPILRWIPDNAAEITREQLDARILEEYPQAGQAARDGLGAILMRFDETFAEGNANGKVSRSELSGAGLVLGVLAQTDFSQGITIPAGAIPPVAASPGSKNTIDITPLVGKLIQQKLDQQLYNRYPVQSASKLSQDDLRLEWMQLALRFFLADKLVHHYAPTDGKFAGELTAEQALGALAAWGIPQYPHYAKLLSLYDNAAMGGDGDAHYGSIEAFNYLTDLEFARALHGTIGSDFSARSLTANPRKQYILATLLTLMPRTGEALFMNDLDPRQLAVWGVRTEYWNGFTQFDQARNGGNGDGAIDDGETAMALVYAKLVEDIYEIFDVNHDTYLVRAEGNALFAAFGITDSRVIDAIYADIGLDSASPTFWQKLRIFFEGDHGWHWLRPYDFHVRLVQLAPRILNPEDR